MSTVQTLGPFPGVPDDFVRALNDRFRELSAGGATTPDTPQEYKTNDNGLTYRLRDGRWIYASGMLLDLLAKRPANFDASDAGALFLASDTYQTYQWSGVAWVEVTPANDVQIAYATGSPALALSVTHTDIAGGGPSSVCGFALNRAGRYLISATFYFIGVGAGDVGQNLFGLLSADGVEQTPVAVFVDTLGNCGGTVGQQWVYTPTVAGKIVKLRGAKSGGAGSSIVSATHTAITAVWIGP